MIGRVISRYKIIEQLGHGGMGVVYKARDMRLERLVALKFLGTGAAENELARTRFMQEARAASALDHPNICTIYGIEDTDDGHMFIAMSCYEGENLRRRLERGSMSVKEAASVAIQVAQGLGKAHDHGIVHRDVKPGNVMLTSDGGVKLLDFGLALLGESLRSTQPGTSVGTPAYMSPEQIRGELCDARTDVWSLGVMLYEMLTGQLPFSSGPVHAMMHSIMQNEIRPPGELRQGIPPAFDTIVARALEKDRDRRYQTTRYLAADLRAEIQSDGSTQDVSITQTNYSIPTGGLSRGSSPSVARVGLSLLVLPFTNLSSDPENEYFADGLTEELITDLGQIPGLLVVSRNSAFQFKGKPTDVRRTGQELRVTSVLEGSVRKAGDRLRITAQLVNVADGYQVWSQRFDRRLEDVFAIQDEIVASIVSALRAKLTVGAVELAPAPRRRPENLEAWNFYLKGRYYVNRQTPDGLQKAKELFERAIAEDPAYAPAWAGLADYYIAVGFWSVMPAGEIWPKARRNALRAVELDPDLAHAQTALGYVRIFCDWDWREAGHNFRRAVELDPADSNAAYANGLYLTQMSRTDEALAEFRRAMKLDPLAMNVNTGLALIYYYRREFDKAIAQGIRTLELDAAYFEMRTALGLIYLQTARFDEGLKYLEGVREESGDNPLILGMLGYGYGVAANDESARGILGRLTELAAAQYVAPISYALIFIGLGDHDAAFEWLNKAATAHDSLVCYLDVMPCYDPLRHDARFPALRRRMGLESDQSDTGA
jgi:eukaryotic-like serine/threonine-protein kinase